MPKKLFRIFSAVWERMVIDPGAIVLDEPCKTARSVLP